jgi:hypothetical protein
MIAWPGGDWGFRVFPAELAARSTPVLTDSIRS